MAGLEGAMSAVEVAAGVKKGLDAPLPLMQRVGLADKLVAAVQAIQGPREVKKGHFRNLLSSDVDLCIAIGGHRGMGENLWNDVEGDPLNLPNLWRENTIKSFMKAHQHGATFVEFDVQVTKDGVPVIWHDDNITFGSPVLPISCKVEDITLQEFKSIGPRPIDQSGQLRELIPLQRAFRSRRTGQQVSKGSNLWQCFDDDELPTLEHTLNALPPDMGLNLEVKMTTPNNVPSTDPSEVERVVSAILKTITQFRQSRGPSGYGPLVLSSFDPDVCKALCQQQSEIPVMFITAGGSELHANPLRMSADAAINFAHSHGMEGVVIDSSVLRRDISCISVARQKGLKVMSYGLENNDIDWVHRQSDVGVHGAIVDDVVNILPALFESRAKRQEWLRDC